MIHVKSTVKQVAEHAIGTSTGLRCSRHKYDALRWIAPALVDAAFDQGALDEPSARAKAVAVLGRMRAYRSHELSLRDRAAVSCGVRQAIADLLSLATSTPDPLGQVPACPRLFFPAGDYPVQDIPWDPRVGLEGELETTSSLTFAGYPQRATDGSLDLSGDIPEDMLVLKYLAATPSRPPIGAGIRNLALDGASARWSSNADNADGTLTAAMLAKNAIRAEVPLSNGFLVEHVHFTLFRGDAIRCNGGVRAALLDRCRADGIGHFFIRVAGSTAGAGHLVLSRFTTDTGVGLTAAQIQVLAANELKQPQGDLSAYVYKFDLPGLGEGRNNPNNELAWGAADVGLIDAGRMHVFVGDGRAEKKGPPVAIPLKANDTPGERGPPCCLWVDNPLEIDTTVELDNVAGPSPGFAPVVVVRSRRDNVRLLSRGARMSPSTKLLQVDAYAPNPTPAEDTLVADDVYRMIGDGDLYAPAATFVDTGGERDRHGLVLGSGRTLEIVTPGHASGQVAPPTASAPTTLKRVRPGDVILNAGYAPFSAPPPGAPPVQPGDPAAAAARPVKVLLAVTPDVAADPSADGYYGSAETLLFQIEYVNPLLPDGPSAQRWFIVPADRLKLSLVAVGDVVGIRKVGESMFLDKGTVIHVNPKKRSIDINGKIAGANGVTYELVLLGAKLVAM